MVHETTGLKALISLVPMLASRGRNRSSVIAENAFVFSTCALKEAMDIDEDEVHMKILTNKEYIKDLSNGLNGRSATAKKATKKACLLLLDTFGEEDWAKAIADAELSARKVG
jgi:hypothetical protein